jgi:hypothetical protein
MGLAKGVQRPASNRIEIRDARCKSATETERIA